MGKCGPCASNKCQGKYANRAMCEGRASCSCTCGESSGATLWKAAASIGGGVLCVAGGVTLTVLTGGVAAVVVGGAIVGGGASLLTNPIGKQMTGERMSAGDLAKDVAVGCTIGVVSGGLGAGGSALAKGATTTVKVITQVGAQAATGVTGGAITETAKAFNGEEVSVGSFVKSMTIGGVCGAVGGASSQVANVASKTVTNGVLKAATRVIVNTASVAATDATIQVFETGEVDGKRLLMTVGTAATISTTAECTRNMTMKTKAFTGRMNADLVEEAKWAQSEEEIRQGKPAKEVPKDDRAKIIKGLNEANKILTPELVAELETKIETYQELKERLELAKAVHKELKVQHEIEMKATHDPNVSKQEAAQNRIRIRNANEPDINTMKSKISNLQNGLKTAEPKMLGKSNLHILHKDPNRQGQFALDIPDENSNGRGLKRVVVDVKVDGGVVKAVFADALPTHKYEDACRFGERQYENPIAPVVSPNQEVLLGADKKKKSKKAEKED